MEKQITIKNVGPIKSLDIPLSPEGGIVVLVGKNDIGKTEAIRAVNALAGNKEKLSARYGQSKGSVSGGGVELTVAGSTRRKGSAEFEVLEGHLSMADLVDPGIQDPKAADTKRIKALVTLAGKDADLDLFKGLFPSEDEFTEAISGINDGYSDVVTMASRVKRIVESKARDIEEQSKEESAKAEALSFVDINMDYESDPVKLQAELESALKSQAVVLSKVTDAEAATKRAVAAQSRLSDLHKGNEGGNDLSRIQAGVTASELVVMESKNVIGNLKDNLQLAEACLQTSYVNLEKAKLLEKDEIRRVETIQECEKILSETSTATPTDEEISQSAEKVTKARLDLENGAFIRNAKEKKHEATARQITAENLALRSDRLRKAAKGVDGVLSDIVSTLGCPLKVTDGRLYVGEKTYSELSHGTRWKLALDIGIEAVGKDGLLPIPQEAWEGLDYENRQLIAEHVKGTGVNIITAEASRAPGSEGVQAELFNSGAVDEK